MYFWNCLNIFCKWLKRDVSFTETPKKKISRNFNVPKFSTFMVISFPYLVIFIPLRPLTVAKKPKKIKNQKNQRKHRCKARWNTASSMEGSKVEPLPLTDFTFETSYLLVETHVFVHSEVKCVGLFKHLSLSNCERHTLPNFCPTTTMCYWKFSLQRSITLSLSQRLRFIKSCKKLNIKLIWSQPSNTEHECVHYTYLFTADTFRVSRSI